MSTATAVVDMGEIQKAWSEERVFARDFPSIEIGVPSRPQLNLVYIPGLIHTETK